MSSDTFNVSMIPEPNDDDWHRWHHWNQKMTYLQDDKIDRTTAHMAGVMEKLVQAPMAYYYENDSWSDTLDADGLWRKDISTFYPTSGWIRRAEELRRPVIPWKADGWVTDAPLIWNELLQCGIHANVRNRTTEHNTLLRIFVITGKYVQSYGFEVSNRWAEQVRLAVQRSIEAGPILLLDPEEVEVVKKLRQGKLGEMMLDGWDELG